MSGAVRGTGSGATAGGAGAPRGVADRLRRGHRERAAFFRAAAAETAETNLHSMRVVCVCALALVAALTLVALALFPGWGPSLAHLALAVLLLVLLGLSRLLKGWLLARPRATWAACGVLQALLLAFVVVLDTQLSPEAPAALMQPACIALVVVFVVPPAVSLGVTAAAEAVYVGLVVATKPDAIARCDVFAALVGLVVAVAVGLLVLRLRARDFAAREHYRELSQTDALSGILNKSAVMAAVREFLESGDPEAAGCLIVLDIDDFKHVNDCHGHAAGDRLLAGMGKVLLALFRSTDAVGRFGGDEFVVLARGLAEREVIEAKLAALLDRVRQLGRACVGEDVTASVGAAVVVGAQVTLEEAFAQADAALYDAKRAGKAGFVVRGPVRAAADGGEGA